MLEIIPQVKVQVPPLIISWNTLTPYFPVRQITGRTPLYQDYDYDSATCYRLVGIRSLSPHFYSVTGAQWQGTPQSGKMGYMTLGSGIGQHTGGNFPSFPNDVLTFIYFPSNIHIILLFITAISLAFNNLLYLYRTVLFFHRSLPRPIIHNASASVDTASSCISFVLKTKKIMIMVVAADKHSIEGPAIGTWIGCLKDTTTILIFSWTLLFTSSEPDIPDLLTVKQRRTWMRIGWCAKVPSGTTRAVHTRK